MNKINQSDKTNCRRNTESVYLEPAEPLELGRGRVPAREGYVMKVKYRI